MLVYCIEHFLSLEFVHPLLNELGEQGETRGGLLKNNLGDLVILPDNRFHLVGVLALIERLIV